MTGNISTFTISLPIHDEALTVMLLLFHGEPGLNRKKSFSHSIVCRTGGMKILGLNATITSDYGKGATISDSPVIKDDQFGFFNQGYKPAFIRIKLNIKAEGRRGNIIAAVFLVDLCYTLRRFFVSRSQSRYNVKQNERIFSNKAFNYVVA